MKKIRLISTAPTALAALAALCVIAAVAACGSESTSSTEERETETATAEATSAPSPTGTAQTTSAPAADAGATITIASMSFGEPVTVAPGAQVTIKNDDSAEHSVTSQTAGQFDVHVDGKQQGTLTAPSAPGEYAFYCIYHPSMKGTLIVK